eukprot:4427272-Amphidinium_carterae.1
MVYGLELPIPLIMTHNIYLLISHVCKAPKCPRATTTPSVKTNHLSTRFERLASLSTIASDSLNATTTIR